MNDEELLLRLNRDHERSKADSAVDLQDILDSAVSQRKLFLLGSARVMASGSQSVPFHLKDSLQS